MMTFFLFGDKVMMSQVVRLSSIDASIYAFIDASIDV